MLSQLPNFVIELAPVSRANRFPDFPTLNTTYFAKEGPSPHNSSLVKDKLLEFALTLVHKMWAKNSFSESNIFPVLILRSLIVVLPY